MTFEDYKTSLDGKNVKIDDIYSFKSKGLQTYSVISSKVALCNKDSKRILYNKYNTYAIGHFRSKLALRQKALCKEIIMMMPM